MQKLVLGLFLCLALCCSLGRAQNGLEDDAGPAPFGQLVDDVLEKFDPNADDVDEEEEKEAVTGKPFCLGCPMEVDVNNEKVKDVANFAFLKHLNNFRGEERAQGLVRVVGASTQVVAGQKFILDIEVGVMNCTKSLWDKDQEQCRLDPKEETFICSFEVVERLWLDDKREVVKSDCKRDSLAGDAPIALLGDADDDASDAGDTEEGAVSRRRKRDTASVLGGQRDAEESPEKLMDLAVFAMQQLDTIDADDEARIAVEVLESKKRTVAGWMYDMKVRVAFTSCKENDASSTWENCKDKVLPPYRVCSIKILFQPWQTVQKKVTESNCYPEKSYYKKKGKKLDLENTVNLEKQPKKLIGGFVPVDEKSEELKELLSFVVDAVDAQSNALHKQKLVKVIEAQRQVVSGIKTKMVIELGYTGCRKNKPAADTCEIDESRDHQFCNITVWEQPWAKKRQLTHSKCGPREHMFRERQKRSFSHFHFDKGMVSEEQKDFDEFRKKHGKEYSTREEYTYRLGVFRENMQKVKLLQQHEEGTAEYGATFFADLTEEEFTKRHLGLRPDLRHGLRAKQAKIPGITQVPDSFDWRNYSAVTPVKNQGMCGSCWAFSVTGNIEGLYAKKHGELVSFSEQELVDCDTLDEGCNGGLPENAYKALEKIGGLETESAYPYNGHKDKTCTFDRSKVRGKVTGFVELPKNETDMQKWLVKNGPISIGINANAMQFYMGGVSHPWKFLCSKKSLDHGVLIVGYGVHTTSIRHKVLPYWIVKNSWGPSWGEKGYYRVYRGENTCGLAEMATSAVVE